ncbi:M48 family metallopeptidase [Peptococcaceae bacterium]|nr:M48 family metallopeptidase [Peptococcaceae bacterium]MCL0052306.1 M48 family metallopeptidase [Peptococcaceae bacterium]
MSEVTREDVLNLCGKWEKELRVSIKRVQIREMKRKWGSCSKDGTLTLNKELLNMPIKCVEYVIVHELLHLMVPNHGRTFKTLLYAYLPEWEEIHEYLENNSKK